jgi:ABC-type polysaccharide/polyol phosphate export permease
MNRSRPVAVDDDFLGDVHVYERHKVGLPRLRPYFRELWRRREFALELSRSNLRSQHYATFFGQLWLILNPLLLGTVYYVLVAIIRHNPRGVEFLAHLLGGLFIFYFASNAINQGANSVVGGGRLILNTAFPRILLPISSTLTAFMRFLPTLLIYAVAHTVAGLPVSWALLWTPALFLLIAVFVNGVASFFATLQVYFRDTSSFLPYVVRMWLYLSPILWTLDDVTGVGVTLKPFLALNPLYPMLGAWGQIMNRGESPSAGFLLGSLAWAVGTAVVGTLFYVSREREFAVRL